MKTNDFFKDLDFIQVNQNGRFLFSLQGKDWEGKTKKELGEYLGKQLGMTKVYLNIYPKKGKNTRCPLTTIVYRSETAASITPPAANNEIYGLFRELKEENKALHDRLTNMQINKTNGNESESDFMAIVKNIIPLLSGLKNQGANQLQPLADNVSETAESNIPDNILQILERVDWEKASPMVAGLLEKYGNLIPIKK